MDAFLEDQKALQQKVRSQLNVYSGYQPADASTERIENQFRLLQACDNLSLLTFEFPARFVSPALFTSKEDLREKFNTAEVHKLAVTVEGA